MPLIKGDKLTTEQRALVLRAFVYRWTVENQRDQYRGECPACNQARQYSANEAIHQQLRDGTYHAHHMPIGTDDQWIKDHAFHFTIDGRLSKRKRYAEPAYLAD